MKATLSILLALLVVGCVQRAKLTGPDGRDAVALQCPSDVRCFQAAGKHCGKRGYTVLAASPHFTKACNADPKVYGVLNPGTGFRDSSTLIVQCR
jgi:hypothetical protein